MLHVSRPDILGMQGLMHMKVKVLYAALSCSSYRMAWDAQGAEIMQIAQAASLVDWPDMIRMPGIPFYCMLCKLFSRICFELWSVPGHYVLAPL